MTTQTQILIHTPEDYQQLRSTWENQSVVLVPTMGALHEGHFSLVKLAQAAGDRVVVSIFVNPLQFGPKEDFKQYPRSLASDVAACEKLGVDAVFAPDTYVMYPNTETTRVTPPESLTNRMCGAFRPGHFIGVATVVMKLFQLIQPDKAVFGEKDAQQLAVIRRMVQDFNLPIKILAAPIVRETSGLALSSRNQYLKTEDEKKAATVLYRTLNTINDHANHTNEMILLLGQTIASFTRAQQDLIEHEYMEAVDPETLARVTDLKPGVLLMMAAKIGDVRLIDNLIMTGSK